MKKPIKKGSSSMPKLVSMILPFIMLFACCKGQKKTTDASNENTHAIELMLTDTFFDKKQPEMMVVKSEKELKGFYIKVNRTRKPGLPLPVVDFTKNMLLIYCGDHADGPPRLGMEKDTDGGIMVGIPQKSNKAKRSKDGLRRFSIYRLPFSKKEVSFQEKR